MTKRVFAFVLVCVIALCLFACGKEQPLPTAFPDGNFNNSYWSGDRFWAYENTLFYLQDGFYNMGIYRSDNGEKVRLLQENDLRQATSTDCWLGGIYPCGSYLYFELGSSDGYVLYRYDLISGTYAPLIELPRTDGWLIVGDFCVYREGLITGEKEQSALYIHNLRTDTRTLVCPDVVEFGIVNGQLRYLTYTVAYALYQYDGASGNSLLLGTFSCDLGSDYDHFNFTSDTVILHNYSWAHQRNLTVYTISSQRTAAYTLPLPIHQLTAYDRYAYAVLFDTTWDSSQAIPGKENGLYRIDLTDGSYEKILSDADDLTEIHVVSDDQVYIIQGSDGFLSLLKRHVYILDIPTGKKEKLAVL